MSKVIVTKNYYEILVSDKGYEKCRGRPWFVQEARGTHYAYSYQYYSDANGKRKRKKFYMHRFLTNCPPDLEVHHKDHNGLNNTEENLVITTSWRNCFERNFELGFCGYRGVNAVGFRFRARIQYKGDRIELGTFSTPELAAKAYDLKAIELYGPHIYTNFDISEYNVPVDTQVAEEIPF